MENQSCHYVFLLGVVMGVVVVLVTQYILKKDR